MQLNLRWLALGLSSFLVVGYGGMEPTQQVTDQEAAPSQNEEDLHFDTPAPWSTVTSHFGGPKNHTGVDFGNPAPKTVKAIERGRVVEQQQEACHGKYVVIQHPNGVYSMYAHMADVADDVQVGAEVEKGQSLGTPGRTGTCPLGIHLHLSMAYHWDGAESWNTTDFFDPEEYIKNHE